MIIRERQGGMLVTRQVTSKEVKRAIWKFIKTLCIFALVIGVFLALPPIDPDVGIEFLFFVILIIILYYEYKYNDYKFYKKYYDEHEPDWRDNPPR